MLSFRRSTAELDPLLRPLVDAREPEAAEILARLLAEQAEPLVREIVTARLRAATDGAREREDVQAEIRLALVRRLRALRGASGASGALEGGEGGNGQNGPIADFRGYVAVVAYHACAAHRRGAGREVALESGDGGDRSALLADDRADALLSLEQRRFLRALWEEIRELPPRQCAALLLNLRDAQGRDAVSLLPLTGTASLREVAAVLGLPAERFAELWQRLPLDDASIAALLGATRQQVINLRKSARARLTRRLRIWM